MVIFITPQEFHLSVSDRLTLIAWDGYYLARSMTM